MALMEAMVTEAWYVGALGSERTTEKRLARLRQLGIDDEQIARREILCRGFPGPACWQPITGIGLPKFRGSGIDRPAGTSRLFALSLPTRDRGHGGHHLCPGLRRQARPPSGFRPKILR